MYRQTACLLLTLACAIFGSGCTHYFEGRAIAAFTQSLESGDLEQLKTITSREFQESALRREDASQSFKQLALPKGDMKILDVEDEGDRKKVMVEVGETKRRVMYVLERDPETRRWVIDDMEVRKKLKHGQTKKTISEQMDLLLSIQEFLDAWESESRDLQLAATTPEFRKILSDLPAPCLEKLITQATSELDAKKAMRPRVEGHGETAVVSIPRNVGDLLVTMKYTEGAWKADDVHTQLKRSGEEIPSMRKMASVMSVTNRFIEAYRTVDRGELEQLSSERFFNSCLREADLSTAALPPTRAAAGEMEVQIHSSVAISPLEDEREKDRIQRAVVILKSDQEILNLTLVSKTRESERELKGGGIAPFVVDEVTINDPKSGQQRNVSAVFQSRELATLFANALAADDLTVIRHLCTQDFNDRVWKHMNDERLPELPMEGIGEGVPTVGMATFKGSLTEVSVEQGKQLYTFQMVDVGGRLQVDDILFPALDRPNSLKLTLEAMMPLRFFALGLESQNLNIVKQLSSKDFNQTVWSNCKEFPALPADPRNRLNMKISKLLVTPETAFVHLGTERVGAKVFMKRESGHLVVDDIVLVGGSDHEVVDLKSQLRVQVSHFNSVKGKSVSQLTDGTENQ